MPPTVHVWQAMSVFSLKYCLNPQHTLTEPVVEQRANDPEAQAIRTEQALQADLPWVEV